MLMYADINVTEKQSTIFIQCKSLPALASAFVRIKTFRSSPNSTSKFSKYFGFLFLIRLYNIPNNPTLNMPEPNPKIIPIICP